MNYLIIAAGGSGQRMKHKDNKIFLKIRNKEIICWTLKAFDESSVIDGIIVSAKNADQAKIKKIIAENKIKKVLAIVPAGETRQESVWNALSWLKKRGKKDDLVGIHNAANPFVFKKEIKEVFLAASVEGAALLAHPATDTIKITEGNNMVNYTPSRAFCWYAQTPQVGFYGDLLDAFSLAKAKNFVGTDDTELLEKINIKAKIISCSRFNFKITFPEDFDLAKKLLPVFIKEDRLSV